jgi:hypothetical protein
LRIILYLLLSTAKEGMCNIDTHAIGCIELRISRASITKYVGPDYLELIIPDDKLDRSQKFIGTHRVL